MTPPAKRSCVLLGPAGGGRECRPALRPLPNAPSLSNLEFADFGAQRGSEIGTVQREGDVGDEEAELRAAIVGTSVETRAVKGLRSREVYHAVGELDLAARALLDMFENTEDFRLQYVTPGNDQVRGGGPLWRLLHHALDLERGTEVLADLDDAVEVRLLVGDLLHRD